MSPLIVHLGTADQLVCANVLVGVALSPRDGEYTKDRTNIDAAAGRSIRSSELVSLRLPLVTQELIDQFDRPEPASALRLQHFHSTPIYSMWKLKVRCEQAPHRRSTAVLSGRYCEHLRQTRSSQRRVDPVPALEEMDGRHRLLPIVEEALAGLCLVTK